MLNDLGEKDYVWKPIYKLEKPEHPNGLSYYNSYIYMVAVVLCQDLVQVKMETVINSV